MGWRNVFFVFGAASLLWLVPWLAETRKSAAPMHALSADEAPSYWAIIRKREAWGSSLGHFCANYVLYFVISWLPLYLVKSRGLSMAHMAELGSAIYIAYAASMALTGWLSDRWIAAGAATTFVRKAGAMGGLAIVAFCLVLTAAGGTKLSLVGLFCAAVALGTTFPNFYAISQTLPGARAAGKWMGFQNCLANIAGIIAPLLTGVLVDRTGQFYWSFIVAGAFALTGLAGWGLLMGEVKPLEWRKSA
jgi:MFS family permease